MLAAGNTPVLPALLSVPAPALGHWNWMNDTHELRGLVLPLCLVLVAV